MDDPMMSRLQLAQQEIDRVFGDGYGAAHPELVIAVMQSAASDWAAARLGVAIERVAEALLVEEEAAVENGSGIVRPNGLVARP
jgi:hypothetical protein